MTTNAAINYLNALNKDYRDAILRTLFEEETSIAEAFNNLDQKYKESTRQFFKNFGFEDVITTEDISVRREAAFEDFRYDITSHTEFRILVNNPIWF